MKYGIFVLVSLFALMFIQLHAQINLPSLQSPDYFRSINVAGSESERYYSMRMQALGLGFQGLIEDGLTDLYRNPAYFQIRDRQTIFGDIVREPEPHIYYYRDDVYPSSESNSSVFPLKNFSTTLNGLRFGYAGRFGILARGNHSLSSTDRNSETDYSSSNPNSYQINKGYYKAITDYSSDFGDIQFSYGIGINENVSLGASYTLAYATSPMDVISESIYSNYYKSYNYSSDSSISTGRQISTISGKTIAHILRCGLLYQTEMSSYEAVATVDLASNDNFQDYDNTNEYEDYYRYDGSSSSYYQRQYSRASTSVTHGKFDASVTTAKLDLRYFTRTENERTFSTRLSFGVSFLSGNELNRGNSHSFYRQTTDYVSTGQSDSYESSSGSEYTRIARPDGNGYFVNAAAGWGFRVKHLYLLIGGNGIVTKNVFDYDDELFSKTSYVSWVNDTGYSGNSIEKYAVVHHKNTETDIWLSLPVGVEYEPWEDFFARAGWQVSYYRHADKDISTELSTRHTTESFNTSKVTLGAGVQIIESLRADFLCIGDIGSPKNWQISVQYDL